MKHGIFVTKGENTKQILLNPNLFHSFGVRIDGQGATILKAGTPVGGPDSHEDDSTVVLFNTSSEPTNTQGVLLHDVDLSRQEDGVGNGTMLTFGFVNLNRMDEDVQALITPAIRQALEGRVTFARRN